MKTHSIFLVLLVAFHVSAYAQTAEEPKPSPDKLSIGVGAGLDYGGFGANVLFYPQRNIGLFAGAGYAMAGFGFNAGAKFRLLTKKQMILPFATAMYGYNAALIVENAEEHNKLFYGPSFGAGIDFKFKSASKGYWSLALLVPVRGTQVDDYLDELRTEYQITMKNELLPVAFSIGYHFVIK